VSASRDALVVVLTQHQDTPGGLCLCGDEPPPCDCHEEPEVCATVLWMPRHQADVLAAAGIHPFRVLDPVEQ
jgi:hypothetical protein